MKNFLIFKTDRLGDLLNISPIISNIKLHYPSSEITLICSKYNCSLARYYENDLNLIIYNKPLLFFLIKNFKKLITKKYDAILQLDGKNHSYMISTFLRSKNKLCVKYIKNKEIFGNFFRVNRPNFLLNFFFNYSVVSYEDYNHLDNKKFHYLNLYLKLLEKIKIKIFSKNHILPFKNPSNITKFNKNYILLHLDTRWNEFSDKVISSLIKKINYISKDNNLVISSNVGSNDIFEKVKHEFSNHYNIELIEGPNLNNILNLIYFSSTCISSHSGLIVHSAAAFNKNIIDIVSPKIFNELDRWIPFNVNYKRYDINNFINIDFNLKS